VQKNAKCWCYKIYQTFLYESKYRRSFWRALLVVNGQFTIFQKKLSEKKNDNVQKTAKATPSTTLALYMSLIHTM